MEHLSISEWFYTFTQNSFVHFPDIRGFSVIRTLLSVCSPVIRDQFDEKPYPYFSKTLLNSGDLWHISLSTWFLDYIYIPLGGSRCKKTKINSKHFYYIRIQRTLAWSKTGHSLYGESIMLLLFIPLLLLNKNRRYTRNIALLKVNVTFFKSCTQILGTFLCGPHRMDHFPNKWYQQEAFDYLSSFSPSLFEISFLW